MKRSPKPVAWMKVYDSDGGYRASFVHTEDAAAFVAILGEGANVRNGHGQNKAIWCEGREDFSAGESYDRASEYMRARVTPCDSRCTHCKGAVVPASNGGMRHVWWYDQAKCGEPTEVESVA